ncbi:MAG: hypothetical protein SGARI_007974 [Bacillariaceae sp.]
MPAVQKIIRNDKFMKDSASRTSEQGWLGVDVIRQPIIGSNATSASSSPLARIPCCVTKVERNSPAATAGIRPWIFNKDTASIQYGDAIVAVGGNTVESGVDALVEELSSRKVGENVAVTVENIPTGERRVVYATLEKRPEGQI